VAVIREPPRRWRRDRWWDRSRGHGVGDLAQGGHADGGGGRGGPVGGVDDRLAAGDALEDGRSLGELCHVADGHRDVVATHLPLEAAGVATGDDVPVVDHEDVVGEPIGLLEVLRGEQQGGAAVHQQVEHRPQLGPRPRVEAGGGLVEEEHLGSGHERGRQVEAPPHAAGVARHDAVAGVVERELDQQLAGAGLGVTTPELVQLAQHDQVLGAGEQRVDGCVLGREADAPAHLGGLREHVEPRHRGRALVGLGEGGEDPDGGGLAGAVGPQHGRDGARGHGHVDPVERSLGTVPLHQAGRLDSVAARHHSLVWSSGRTGFHGPGAGRTRVFAPGRS
jgi:hypothetical protein